MAGPTTKTGNVPANFVCLTGVIQRRSPVDIFQRGTHLLVDVSGRVRAVLRPGPISLFGLEGRFVTVCGIIEMQIEGATSLLVTQVFPPYSTT